MYDVDGTARDHATAANWFRNAAGNGDLFSMWRLGWQLRTGDGIRRNDAEAVQWFTKAAQKGDARSEAALGEGYMSGSGGRIDYRSAAYRYERAANKGEASAQINLSTLYSNGWSVARDPQGARSLLVQASRSSEPFYACAARERLAQPSGGGGSNVDALLGAAAVGLVGLLLYSACNGGGSGGGGGGSSMSLATGGSPTPWGGGSSTMGPMQSLTRTSTPMSGNTTTTLHGIDAYRGVGPPALSSGRKAAARSGVRRRRCQGIGRGRRLLAISGHFRLAAARLHERAVVGQKQPQMLALLSCR